MSGSEGPSSSSAVHAAPAPARGRAPDGENLGLVLSKLRGQAGLNVQAHAVQAVLVRYPAADVGEAADEVLRWRARGVARSRDAAALLTAALGSQEERLARALPYGPRQAWVRRHVPDMPEAAALAALFGLRAAHGRDGVTAAMVRDRVQHRARREGWEL